MPRNRKRKEKSQASTSPPIKSKEKNKDLQDVKISTIDTNISKNDQNALEGITISHSDMDIATADISISSENIRKMNVSNSGKCMNFGTKCNEPSAHYTEKKHDPEKKTENRQDRSIGPHNKEQNQPSTSNIERSDDEDSFLNPVCNKPFSKHVSKKSADESKEQRKLKTDDHYYESKGHKHCSTSNTEVSDRKGHSSVNKLSWRTSSHERKDTNREDNKYFTKESSDERKIKQPLEKKSKVVDEFDFFMHEYANDKKMEFQVVNEVFGDLFLAGDAYSLGHCVAEDMNMGSGIAITFRQIFKRVDQLLNQRVTQGGLAVLEDKERYIYYLVTKKVSNGKPTYLTLWRSLQEMKKHIINNHVMKLALPRIGCGLDSLEWEWVKKMLEYIFRGVDVEIKIFNFQQDINAPSSLPLRKCKIVNQAYPITEIEKYTAIVYFGSEDGKITEDIESLSGKFGYIRNIYRMESKTVGTCIRTDKHNMDQYIFYGCIVRKLYTDSFDYTHFQKCLSYIQTQNRKDKYWYVAFQAFLEEDSTFIVSKIINLMRYALSNVDIYVCWPERLLNAMPTSSYY